MTAAKVIQLTGDIREDQKLLYREVNRLEHLIKNEELQDSIKRFNEEFRITVETIYADFYNEYDDEGGYYPAFDSLSYTLLDPKENKDFDEGVFDDSMRDSLYRFIKYMYEHDYNQILRSENGIYEFIK